MLFAKPHQSNFQMHYNGSRQGYEFFLTLPPVFPNTKRLCALPIKFEEYENSVEPFFVLKDGSDFVLQQMIDALWRYGVRPTDMGPINSTLEAKDKHLEDLRTLLFHNVGLKT